MLTVLHVNTASALRMSETLFEALAPKVSLRFRPLLNPYHPLQTKLREIMPGAYIHSLCVGSAAAIAASHIGANADLARCIGIYHDTGKLANPDFFAGAVSGDRLQALTIKDKQELALLLLHPWNSARILGQYQGFPPKVLEGVEQHHGRMRTYANIGAALLGTITEPDLHYPGTLPTTKEAALVMIADNSEAYLAKLYRDNRIPNDPTRKFFRGVVHKVILDLMGTNQFSNSHLTIPEIEKAEGIIMWFFYRYYNGLPIDHTPDQFRKHDRSA
ncbi:HD domain-containing protein [Candidatus Saganbacteria bacterium]|nr:HD domain-containing protein [Candidatus Saganbacteria bacterium]